MLLGAGLGLPFLRRLVGVVLPRIVGETGGSGPGTSVTVPAPTGTQPGDVLIGIIVPQTPTPVNPGDPTIVDGPGTAPNGPPWEVVATDPTTGAVIITRPVEPDEPDEYTATIPDGNGSGIGVVIIVVRPGVPGGGVVVDGGIIPITPGTTHPVPEVTPPANGGTVIVGGGGPVNDEENGGGWQPPGGDGWTPVTDRPVGGTDLDLGQWAKPYPDDGVPVDAELTTDETIDEGVTWTVVISDEPASEEGSVEITWTVDEGNWDTGPGADADNLITHGGEYDFFGGTIHSGDAPVDGVGWTMSGELTLGDRCSVEVGIEESVNFDGWHFAVGTETVDCSAWALQVGSPDDGALSDDVFCWTPDVPITFEATRDDAAETFTVTVTQGDETRTVSVASTTSPVDNWRIAVYLGQEVSDPSTSSHGLEVRNFALTLAG